MVVTHLHRGRTRCLQPVDDVGVRSVIMLVKSVSDNAAAGSWVRRKRNENRMKMEMVGNVPIEIMGTSIQEG